MVLSNRAKSHHMIGRQTGWFNVNFDKYKQVNDTLTRKWVDGVAGMQA